MRYLSVCSGIESASVAWGSLGWEPLAFSEIEPFPRAVLAQRFPGVRLEGDFTELRHQPWIIDADILVGGTPCQDFSIAGLRAGLAGDRGNLTLEFLRLADAIDALRLAAGRPGVIVVWENVPGVFSHADNPFGAFLAGLVGADAALVPGRGQRWTDAGLVAGPRRTAAWRTLDAQFFGLAQRRERVFVVAGPRDGPHPGKILFEPEGVRGNPPPRRETRQNVARPVAGGSPRGSGYRNDADTAANLIASSEIVGSLTASTGPRGHGGSGLATNGGAEAGHLVAGTVDASSGKSRGAGTNPKLLAFGGNDRRGPIDVASALNGHGGPHGRQDFSVETFIAEPIAFNSREDPISGDLPGALGSSSPQAQAIAFDTTQVTHPENRSNPQPGAPCHPLAAQGHPPAIAFENRARGDDGRGYDRPPNFMVDISPTVNSTKQPAVATTMVRRLTPTECERLQGFPDGWTDIVYRGKPAKDGNRYRAIGNSMAVPVMLWLGTQIQRFCTVLPSDRSEEIPSAAIRLPPDQESGALRRAPMEN